jgi:hypothetical protein
MNPLPLGFWLSLAGMVVGGALSAWMLWRMLRRAPLRRRVRTLAGDESASTIVEFPFALMTLVLITCLTWQLGFMTSAYMVVDYAAYAAVRAAVVIIPQRGEGDGSEEGEARNHIEDITFEDSDKGEEIREAAVFVCTPLGDPAMGLIASIPGGDVIAELGGEELLEEIGGSLGLPARYGYANEFTTARIIVEGQDDGEKDFQGGELVTVEVSHKFALKIAIASRVLGTEEGSGFVTDLRVRASMINEGYPEMTPPDAPSGAVP